MERVDIVMMLTSWNGRNDLHRDLHRVMPHTTRCARATSLDAPTSLTVLDRTRLLRGLRFEKSATNEGDEKSMLR
jgi:hypothetical protein